ncbi:hypothetical protein [Haladaptatus salinisoli]|uniref:hypothetical protein n=1 Tax=Haladaptatus salinisoli TaxID=2884876 RepID=UPI001D0B682D|nr:hypothetical protein [Haladaptatus salinisoli]
MESLDEMSDAVEEATLGIEEVADATDEQAAGAEEVASVIDRTAQNASDIRDETAEFAAVEERTTAIRGGNDAMNDAVD